MSLENDLDGSFTELALGTPQQIAGQAPTHGLFVQFYANPTQDAKATLEEGRPIFTESEYIRIMVPGDKSSIIERPVRIGATAIHDNIKYMQEYTMFKQGVKDALVGMPLTEWAAVTRSQVKELEFFNVRTVEQLAGMPDTAVQNFAGVSTLRAKAIRYMDETKGDAVLNQMQAELETRDNTIETMNNQIKEMQASLAALQNTPLIDRPTVAIPEKVEVAQMHVPEIPDVMPEYVAKTPDLSPSVVGNSDTLSPLPEAVTKQPTKKRRAIKS